MNELPPEDRRRIQEIADAEGRDRRYGVRLVRVSSVKPKAVSWIWPGRLAEGKLTIIEGPPDVGKSTVLLDLAARVSRGLPMPDGTPARNGPRRVLILAADEDGIADTIAPRLIAAGADTDRIDVLAAVKPPDEEDRLFDLRVDMGRLAEIVADEQVGFILVDALMSTIPDGRLASSDSEMRRLLHPLAALADRTRCHVSLNRHHRKAAGSALDKGTGSISISAVARSTLMVVRDPEDESGERRLLAVAKCNLVPDSAKQTMAFHFVEHIIDTEDGEPASVGRVEWGEADPRTADQLLAGPSEPGKLEEASTFLRQALADGPMPAAEVHELGEELGFSEKTIKRARSSLGVRSERVGGAGSAGVWMLSLAKGAKPPKGVKPENVGPLSENVVRLRDYVDDESLRGPSEIDDPLRLDQDEIDGSEVFGEDWREDLPDGYLDAVAEAPAEPEQEAFGVDEPPDGGEWSGS